MINYFIVFMIFFGSFIFINKDIVTKKYNKWKTLKNLISTQHNSLILINLISMKMILQSYYLNFIQYMNNSVRKIDKNKYEVSYVINGKLYKMLISPSRGPIPVLSVTNDDNTDLTDLIIPYLGPNNDWHGNKYYPDFFEEKKLNFELIKGEVKSFSNREIIVI